jgi:hypothetical protein
MEREISDEEIYPGQVTDINDWYDEPAPESTPKPPK